MMRPLAVPVPKTTTDSAYKDELQKIWKGVDHVFDWSVKYDVFINTIEYQSKYKPDEAISPQKLFSRTAKMRGGYENPLEDSYHEGKDDDITDLIGRVNNVEWDVRCSEDFFKQEEQGRSKY